jgi:hypothetical protein
MNQPSLDLGGTEQEFSLIGNDHQTRSEAEQWRIQSERSNPARTSYKRPFRAWYTLWAYGCHSVQLTVYRTPSNREGRAREMVGRAFWDDYQGWMPKAMVTRKQAAAEIRAHRNNARRGQPQTGAERTR